MPFFRKRDVPVDRTSGDPRAARLLEAFAADDLDGVASALAEAGTPEERERMTSLLSAVPREAHVLDAWVEREPDEPAAWLARGAHGIGWAWEARGRDTADNVGRDAFELFFDRLRDAEDDLLRAARLAPEDAVPWCHTIISGRGLQVPKEELWMRYEETQSRHPWLLEAHLQMVQGIAKKWGGSHEEMLDFARRVGREAPAGAPVHAVVAEAHVEVWFDLEDDTYLWRPDVQEEIMQAANRSVFADGFVDDMVGVQALNLFAFAFHRGGADAPAKALVQRLGTRRTEFPWAYLIKGPGMYAKLLGA
jgi:hypothetical protein